MCVGGCVCGQLYFRGFGSDFTQRSTHGGVASGLKKQKHFRLFDLILDVEKYISIYIYFHIYIYVMAWVILMQKI